MQSFHKYIQCLLFLSRSVSVISRLVHVIVLPSMLTFTSCSSRASDNSFSEKKNEEGGRKKASCPNSNYCSGPFSYGTIHLNCIYSFVRWVLNCADWIILVLYLRMADRKATCHALSNAFLKSMMTWYRF